MLKGLNLTLFFSVLAINMIACLAIASLFFLFLRNKELKNQKSSILLPIIFFSLFIPAAGILITIAYFIFLYFYHSKNFIKNVKRFTQEDESSESAKGTKYLTAHLEAQYDIKNPDLSEKKRNEAILAINTMADRESNLTNWQLLSDQSDEIRLYAFGVLSEKEGKIQKYIHSILSQYKSATDINAKAKFALQLARLYCLLVERNLSRGQFKTVTLEQALTYAKEANAFFPNDPQTWLRLALIYAHMGNADTSIAAIEKAKELDAKPSEYLLQLAENLYNQQQFDGLRELLKKHKDLLSASIKLNDIINFWLTHDKKPRSV